MSSTHLHPKTPQDYNSVSDAHESSLFADPFSGPHLSSPRKRDHHDYQDETCHSAGDDRRKKQWNKRKRCLLLPDPGNCVTAESNLLHVTHTWFHAWKREKERVKRTGDMSSWYNWTNTSQIQLSLLMILIIILLVPHWRNPTVALSDSFIHSLMTSSSNADLSIINRSESFGGRIRTWGPMHPKYTWSENERLKASGEDRKKVNHTHREYTRREGSRRGSDLIPWINGPHVNHPSGSSWFYPSFGWRWLCNGYEKQANFWKIFINWWVKEGKGIQDMHIKNISRALRWVTWRRMDVTR